MKKKLQYKKVGRLNKNARYIVNYDKDGKADVKWSYVKKGKSNRHRGLALIIAMLISLLLCWLSSQAFYHFFPSVKLTDCNATMISINGTLNKLNVSGIGYINLTCLTNQNKTIHQLISYDSLDSSWSSIYYRDVLKDKYNIPKGLKYDLWDEGHKILLLIMAVGILIIFLFVWAFLINHIKFKSKKQKWKKLDDIDKWFSERNAKLTSARYRYVFKKVPESNIIEIPIFHNKFLHYKTKGEFDKYLIRVEVKEHPFQQRIENKKKEAWGVNEFLFSCKFYFSQNPKQGSLEVRWK
jgi:hypothetical protein